MKATIELHCATVALKSSSVSQTAVTSRAVQLVYCLREWCIVVVFNGGLVLWHLVSVALMSVCALQLAPCTSTAAQTLVKTYQHLRTVLRRLVLYLVVVTNKTRSV